MIENDRRNLKYLWGSSLPDSPISADIFLSPGRLGFGPHLCTAGLISYSVSSHRMGVRGYHEEFYVANEYSQ